MRKLISKLLLLHLHSQIKSIKVNGKCYLMNIYPFVTIFLHSMNKMTLNKAFVKALNYSLIPQVIQ